MNLDPIRKTLIFLFLALALFASVAYDSLVVQTNDRFQIPLAGVIAASFAAAFLLQRYPSRVIKPVLVAAWPLHLFTIGFFWVCFAFHGGDQLNQFAIYTLFAYAMFLVIPLLFLLDRRMFVAFVKLVAVLSAVLSMPSLVGAAGHESFLGIPLRVKFAYAQLSGINASAGVFEHPEGHAFQMAIGIFCCLYALRSTGRIIFVPCFLLTLAGLIVSQGRAAIYGVAIAILFSLLPELFRRSRPVFFGTLFVALTFPFFILPQLATIPGVAGYLRIERGLSGRSEAWQFATELIEERPWIGYGFMASTKFTEAHQRTLRRSGFSGAGTTFHNTFISRAVDLGLIVTCIYSLLYFVPLVRICRPSEYSHEQALIRSMILLTLTTAIFRDYNIGGIRSTAMMGAMFLGLANLWQFVALWSEAEPMADSSVRESDGMTTANDPEYASQMS